MCPRATAQHAGAAMARAIGVAAASAHSFGEEEYIDLDLSSCGEFEFRVCRSSAAPPCAEELLCLGRPHKGVLPRTGAKLLEADAGGGGGGGGGRRSTATVAPLQHSLAAEPSSAQPARRHAEGSRRKKPGKTVHAKLQASRAFFRSLFARTSCSESDEQCHGIGVRAGSTSSLCQMKNIGGCSGKASIGQPKSSYSSSAGPTTLRRSIEQEKLMDEEEHAASSRQRKSFSGAIRWLPTTKPPSSSRRRSSCSSGCAPPPPALKRSSSARFESEPEGLIQGAIAYCKRSQQQRVLARKSVSDAAPSAPPSWPHSSRPTQPTSPCS